jgi:hypothetical protein
VRSLADRNEHNVHDVDAPDDERDRSDTREKRFSRRSSRCRYLRDILKIANRKIGVHFWSDTMLLLEQGNDACLHASRCFVRDFEGYQKYGPFTDLAQLHLEVVLHHFFASAPHSDCERTTP